MTDIKQNNSRRVPIMSKTGKTETQLQKNIFCGFRYVLKVGAGEYQEEGCLRRRQCHLWIEKVLIAVARSVYCSFHLFQVGQIVSTSTKTRPKVLLFSFKLVGAAEVQVLVSGLNSSIDSR